MGVRGTEVTQRVIRQPGSRGGVGGGVSDQVAPGVRTAPNTSTPGEVAIDVVLSSGIVGGDTLVGGIAAGEDLTLASTEDSSRGSIFVRDQLSLMSEDKTHTDTANPYEIVTYPSARTLTIDAGGSGNAGSAFYGLRFSATVLFENDGYLFGSGALFGSAAVVRNAAGEARNATVNGFQNIPTFTADGATFACGSGGFVDGPIFGVVNGGTATVGVVSGFRSQATVNTGATIATRRGLFVEDSTGAGTVTLAVGVDIAALSDATTSIGIRNASTTVCTPLANANITATSATIRNDASTVTLTANNSYTLASAPTIADGQNGQRLRIINVDTADTITLQDQGTLASSNLRLSATTIALGPRDSIDLEFNSTIGDWVQVGQVNVL